MTLQDGGRQKYDPFDYQEPDTTANLVLGAGEVLFDVDQYDLALLMLMTDLVIGEGGSRLPEAGRNNANGNFNNDQIEGKIIIAII